MGTLTESGYHGTIKSPEEMLALWMQVEVDIAEIGQAYASPGGIAYTFADLDKVRSRVTFWEKRVLAKRGYLGRNTADIAPSSAENGSTL